MNGMASMMGGMALGGWLGVLLLGILLIGAAVALVRLRSPKDMGTYSGLMPVIAIRGVAIGLAPLAQWLILPSLILRLTHWRLKCREHFSG